MSRPHAVRRALALRQRWLGPVLVAGVTALAFAPAVANGFVSWDDDKNFLLNANYRGLGPDQLRWMWTTFHLGTWIPLSWMTLGLDYLLWGMNPAGYHATNVAIHAANAALVFLLARRLLPPTAPRPAGEASASSATRVAWPAVVAALVFAVHPLRVESVAWITERRDVLSGLFYFSCLLAYVRAAQERSRAAYVWALAFAALALLAKGTAVTLPVALALVNVWPLRRLGGQAGWWTPAAQRIVAGLVPFVLLSAVFAIVVFKALQPVEQLPVGGKIAVSVYSLVFYAAKTLVPVGLSPLYAMPRDVNPLAPVFLFSLGLVLTVGGALWNLRRRSPGVAVAVVAFAAILFPLLGVHQGGPQIAADRNTYNASVALALLAGGAWGALWQRAPRLAGATAVAVIATLGALTRRQVGVWRDSVSLWSRVLEVEPNSPLGHNNYGNAVIRLGRVDEAMRHYAAAIRAMPDYAEAHTNLGVALAATGRLTDAIAEYQKALAIRPDDDEALNNWGVALARAGDAQGAIERFKAAIAANPASADAHVNWGNTLVRLGRADDAIAHYEEALRWRPDHADAHHNWGVALAQLGRLAEAIREFEATIAVAPEHQQAAAYLERARELLQADSVRARAPQQPGARRTGPPSR